MAVDTTRITAARAVGSAPPGARFFSWMPVLGFGCPGLALVVLGMEILTESPLQYSIGLLGAGMVCLVLWALGLRADQSHRLRSMIASTRRLPPRSTADFETASDLALSCCLGAIEETMAVRYVPCGPMHDEPIPGYEDWVEIEEEQPPFPAYLIVPARAPLRLHRFSGSGHRFLEPWNPYDAVMLVPGRAEQKGAAAAGHQEYAVAVSNRRFCRDVMASLAAFREPFRREALRPSPS